MVKRIFKNPSAVAGILIVLLVLLFVSIGPLFSPYPINETNVKDRFSEPSFEHWFGTDMLGQDVLVRTMVGGRYSLFLAGISAAITLVLGTFVGLLAGFRIKLIDHILDSLNAFISVIPLLPLLIALTAAFGFDLQPLTRMLGIMIIFGILSFPGLAKIIRAQVLTCLSEDYITAAKVLGIHSRHIVFKHIMPNVLGIVTASATGIVAKAILLELTLSFVGLGFPPPTPTWGNLIPNIRGVNFIGGTDYWIWLFPILSISISIIGINLLGEGIREVFDPKSKGL